MHSALTRPLSVVCLLAAGIVGLAACGSSSEPASSGNAGFPMTVKRCGRTLTFNSPPKRVLVKEYQAETLVAAAGGNMTGRVIGIANSNSEGSNPADPQQTTVANVPEISRNSDVSKETIIGQQPDLVVAHSFEMAPQDQLAGVGIKSMIVNVCCDAYAAAHGGRASFDEIYSDVTLLGKLLGTQSYAARSVAKMKQTVAAVQQQAPSLRRKLSKPTAAFAFLDSGSFFTYGPPSIAAAQIRALGLTNAFGDIKKRGTELSAEEFIARDPGVVVVAAAFKPGETSHQVMQRLLALPGIKRMTAVREHHLIILPNSYILSRAVDGLRYTADQMAKFG